MYMPLNLHLRGGGGEHTPLIGPLPPWGRWIRDGLVGAARACVHGWARIYLHVPLLPVCCVQLNGRKQINMVHVDDIVQASRACLRDPQPKRRINVAGHHFFLSELISHCKHPAVPDAPDQDLSSKCVESNVLLSELMPDGYEFVQPLTRTRA